MKELTVNLPHDLAAVFALDGSGLDNLLAKIREEACSHVPDLETAAGRKAVISLAAMVSRSKVALDAAGKELVSGLKKQTGAIDASRKHARDYLDALRDEIRAPMNAWSKRQAEIVEAEIAAVELLAGHIEALEMDAAWEYEQDLLRREAVVKAESERIERLRLDAERAESARVQAEGLKKAAEEKAAANAEQAIQAEKDRADLAERRRVEENAEAVRAKAEAVEAERKRAADAAAAEKAAAEKLAADRQVQAVVHSDIVADLETAGIPPAIGRDVVRAVVTGKVRGMVITSRAVSG